MHAYDSLLHGHLENNSIALHHFISVGLLMQCFVLFLLFNPACKVIVSVATLLQNC